MSETVTEATDRVAPEGVVLPPRHPRVAQLIHLELAKMDRGRELAEIGAQCEEAAAPIALEIERLEDQEARIVSGFQLASHRRAELARLEQHHRDLVTRLQEERAAQDARLRAEGERFAAEGAELAAADKQRETDRAALAVTLAKARKEFDGARTTGRGRHLERAITKITKQQEVIVARNPDARYYRMEMAIAAEGERLGLTASIKAAAGAMRDPKFGAALGDAIRAFRGEKQAEPSMFEVKVMVLKIIHGMDVTTDDVEVRVVYRASNAHVEVAGLSDAARTKCLASLMARTAKKPIEAEGAAEATAA